jgi:hypothetical protein
MPKFHRVVCGRLINVNAYFVGMGGYIFDQKTYKDIAAEYQWLVTRPDGYRYALDHLAFIDIYCPTDRKAKEYMKLTWIMGATNYLRESGTRRYGRPVSLLMAQMELEEETEDDTKMSPQDAVSLDAVIDSGDIVQGPDDSFDAELDDLHYWSRMNLIAEVVRQHRFMSNVLSLADEQDEHLVGIIEDRDAQIRQLKCVVKQLESVLDRRQRIIIKLREELGAAENDQEMAEAEIRALAADRDGWKEAKGEQQQRAAELRAEISELRSDADRIYADRINLVRQRDEWRAACQQKNVTLEKLDRLVVNLLLKARCRKPHPSSLMTLIREFDREVAELTGRKAAVDRRK